MASHVVVEWTRTTLRLAFSDGEGPHARIQSIASQTIGPSGESADALRALLGKHASSIQQVISVIPREHVITRVVKFPTIRSSELTQMVELYAKAQLPYPREQAVFDFHVISQQDGFSTVAIIASQREVIDRQLAILREAGLSNIFLTVSSWGVLGWYRRVASANADEPTLVVNIDDSRTDLVLLADARVLSSRSVGQGWREWETTADTSELLTLEVERSRAAVRKELPGTEVRSLILTGLGPLSAWSKELTTRLSLPVKAIEASRPLKGVASSLAPPISPVVVGGLASSEIRGLLNLSPLELRVHVRHRQQVQELVMVSLMLLAVFVLGAGGLMLEMTRQQRMATQVEQALADIEPVAKQAQEKTRATQLVRAVLDDRRRFAQMLASVFQSTPPTIQLEMVSFERAKAEVGLRGSAPSTQQVLDYIKQLERLSGVNAVRLKYSTRRSTPDGERTDFELVLQQRQSHS